MAANTPPVAAAGAARAAPAPLETYATLLSHELRTPVTAITGFLDLLEDDGLLGDPAALRAYLSVVRGQAADLARTVAELTTFAGLAAASPSAAGARLGTPTTLSDTLEEIGISAATQVEIAPEACEALVDSEPLGLTLRHLLENAERFSPAGSRVLLRATLEGPTAVQRATCLRVRVTSHGEPIPEALREAIFEPFRQGETPYRRRHRGLGLGLAVARRAAQAAGGSLVLEPGLPTTFRLDLPVRDDAVAREVRALRDRVREADSQTLSAFRDLRALRAVTEQERRAREAAEAQQLRVVGDFRAAHARALALAEQLDSAYLETVTALARAVETRDRYTGGHVDRVRRYSLILADRLGMTAESLRQLEFGAVLHDVGKIGVPDAVLAKEGPLDADEWVVMRRHPEIGRRVLEGIASLVPALDAVAYHHERWDGAGYPARLAGERIPLAGRIVGVADAYDAMTTDRPYRARLPLEVVRAEIERGRGAQFDPDIAQMFLRDLPPPG